jgi:hypothetical protein
MFWSALITVVKLCPLYKKLNLLRSRIMKVNVKTIITIILFVTAYIAVGETPPEGPYFGLEPPGFVPEVFAPGIISLPNRFEHGICFSEDGGECYFVVRAADWSVAQIMVTRYENGQWTTPAVASFSNTMSMSPSLADNDQSMYFSRSADIYKAVRTPTGWSSPVKLAAPVSSSQDDWSVCISTLGNLWTCSWRPGGAGQCDAWRLQYVGGNFINPTNISTVNTTYNECNPVSGPDEGYVIFNSNRPGGYGAMDLYISFADGQGGWKAPRNLGPTINTSEVDAAPYISPDNRYLFFTHVESSTNSSMYWVDIRALFPAPDFSHDGKVDFEDLKILAAYWLTDEPSIDIATEEPDEIINFLDFAVLAQHWLEGM